MTNTALKKELHKAIDGITDQGFLHAVYTILSEKNNGHEPGAEQWEEIERRRKLHKSGKSKSYTWDQTKKMMRAALNK